MKFCPECGEKIISEKAKFCSECGCNFAELQNDETAKIKPNETEETESLINIKLKYWEEFKQNCDASIRFEDFNNLVTLFKSYYIDTHDKINKLDIVIGIKKVSSDNGIDMGLSTAKLLAECVIDIHEEETRIRNDNAYNSVSMAQSREEKIEGTQEVVKKSPTNRKDFVEKIRNIDFCSDSGYRYNDENFEYVVVDDIIAVTKCTNKEIEDIFIDAHVICQNAFSHCKNLWNVDFSDKIIFIDDMAFLCCKNLSYISFSSNISYIGDYAFAGCNTLSIEIPDIKTWCNISFKSAMANPLNNGSRLIIDNTDICDLEIPNDVLELPPFSFHGSKKIKNVNISDSTKIIGKNAFANCKYLLSVHIGKCVKDIPYATDIQNKASDSAFDGCENLIKITVSKDNPCYYSENNCLIDTKTKTLIRGCNTSIIPEGITSIASYAFSYSHITSIRIPESVCDIQPYAFYNCKSISNISVAPKNKVYHSENNCLIETETNILVLAGKNSTVPNYIIRDNKSNHKIMNPSKEETIAISKEKFLSIIHKDGYYWDLPSVETLITHMVKVIQSIPNIDVTSLSVRELNDMLVSAIEETFDSEGYHLKDDAIKEFAKILLITLREENYSSSENRRKFEKEAKQLEAERKQKEKDEQAKREEERKRKAQEEQAKREAEEQRKAEIEARRLEQQRKQAEAKARQEEAERQKKAEEEAKRLAEEERKRAEREAKRIEREKNRKIQEEATRNKEQKMALLFEFEKKSDGTYVITKCKDKNIKVLTIPNGVSEIKSGNPSHNGGVFSNMEELEEVILPKSLKKIGNYAFQGCESLSHVHVVGEEIDSYINFEFPQKLEIIGTHAFAYCDIPNRAIISENVKEIGQYAFWTISDLQFKNPYNWVRCDPYTRKEKIMGKLSSDKLRLSSTAATIWKKHCGDLWIRH